jgi:hypothetical protein
VNAARAITRWRRGRKRRLSFQGCSRAIRERWPSPAARCLLARFACLQAGGEQLPVPLGDDFDGAVGHLDRGLIVNRIRRIWDPGRPSF